MPGESEIISRIRARSRSGLRVIAGIGDDAAVLRPSENCDLLACCDLSIEGIHFRTDWASPRLIGRKALAVNLSDIAAMGGVPLYATLSIAITGHSSEYIDQLFSGITDLADAAGVSIIGGDTSSSPGPMFIDVSVIGECQQGKAVLRSGAHPGDLIFVTGRLGASALGLKLLREGSRAAVVESDDPVQSAVQEAICRHLEPEARVAAGRLIGRSGLATAMIDISDGLSTDLNHILEESRCGALIHAESIPTHPAVPMLDGVRGIESSLEMALHSGEEYELLFTVPSARRSDFEKLAPDFEVPISLIGEIVEGTSIEMELDGKRSAVKPSGYEHNI
ncbi:MAG: thiamine-phosphate kinase [Blastocatellia bacterium]